MSEIRTYNREEDICLLEQKWWAIDRMLVVFDENELPDDIYEKLYLERNRIEDLLPKLKPTNPADIAAQLRIAKRVHGLTWGPGKGAEPCPVSRNLYGALDGIIEFMERLEKGMSPNLITCEEAVPIHSQVEKQEI